MANSRKTPARFAFVLFAASLATHPLGAAGEPGQEASDAPAIDRVVLKTASSHPMKYFFSLPRGFGRQPGRRWPVLVCVDCAGSNFRQLAEAYRRERGELPFLLVCPCTFSNTNEITGHMLDKYRRFYPDTLIRKFGPLQQDLDWDEAGVLTILKDLRAAYDIEERFYITGFSGGGLLAYRMIFKHPDLLAGAALECANFFNPEYRSYKGRFSAAERNFPIHLIVGERDHNRPSTRLSFLFSTPLREYATVLGVGLVLGYLAWRKTRKVRWPIAVALAASLTLGFFILFRKTGLDAQTETAAELLRDLGYGNVKRTEVPGMGHEGRPGPVIETFRPYWMKEKRRDEPLG
jgi:predicted esterase